MSGTGHTTGGKRAQNSESACVALADQPDTFAFDGKGLCSLIEAADIRVSVQCTPNPSVETVSVLVKFSCDCGLRSSQTEYFPLGSARPNLTLLRALLAWPPTQDKNACRHRQPALDAIAALPEDRALLEFLVVLDIEADARVIATQQGRTQGRK